MPWTGKPSPTQWRLGAECVERTFLGVEVMVMRLGLDCMMSSEARGGSTTALASFPCGGGGLGAIGTSAGLMGAGGSKKRIGDLELSETPAVLQVLAEEDVAARVERRLDDEAVPK